MDYLQEARNYLNSGEGIAVSGDDVLSITNYLAGLNAALIAIAERLPPPAVQEEPKHPPKELQQAIETRPPTWAERQAAKDAALPYEPPTRGRAKLFKT